MWQVRFSRPSPSALALVGGDGFVGLRSEGYEIEHWIRFRLIEIEGYGKPVSSNCILEDIGAYDFPANNCGLANVVPGVRLGPRAAEPCPRHELAATRPAIQITTITVFILVTWQSSLLTGRFSLNLGTISRHDEWGSAGWHGVDFACDAHALVLVRGNDLRGSARFRPERYKVEHWIRLGLIKIEGYGFPAASDSILGKAGAYHFSAHDCGLADTVLGIGSGYAPWRGVLRKSERCEPRHTHHKDKVSHRRHIQFHGRAGAEKASTGVRKSARRDRHRLPRPPSKIRGSGVSILHLARYPPFG